MLISVTQNNKPVSCFTSRQVEFGRTQQVDVSYQEAKREMHEGTNSTEREVTEYVI